MEEIERWPKRPRPKTNKDNTFIKETSKEERKQYGVVGGGDDDGDDDIMLMVTACIFKEYG